MRAPLLAGDRKPRQARTIVERLSMRLFTQMAFHYTATPNMQITGLLSAG